MTPAPTKAVLVGSLLTAVATAATALGRLGDDEPLGAAFAGWLLLVLSLLFAIRVAGQLVAVVRAPAWLPRVESGQWNLMPYRFLLPTQLVFLAVMAWIVGSLLAAEGPPTDASPAFGGFLLVLAAVYASAMAIRYVIRMARQPGQRWFGGTIPIVFHWVLAAFLVVLGSYHASH
jgi:hypothetical protein